MPSVVAPIRVDMQPSGIGCNNNKIAWFALRVRSNCERTTASVLEGKGYQAFVPCYRGRRFPSSPSKNISIPLFPGYIFALFDPDDRLPVLMTPGLVSILGIGKLPVPIPHAEIEAIQRMVASPLHVQPWPFLQVGQRVRVHSGPLVGIEGLVLSLRKDCRLVISVDLLQRSVAAEIDSEWVHPIS